MKHGHADKGIPDMKPRPGRQTTFEGVPPPVEKCRRLEVELDRRDGSHVPVETITAPSFTKIKLGCLPGRLLLLIAAMAGEFSQADVL